MVRKQLKGIARMDVTIDYNNLIDKISELVADEILSCMRQKVAGCEAKEPIFNSDYTEEREYEFDEVYDYAQDNGDYYNPPYEEIEPLSDTPTERQIYNYIKEHLCNDNSELVLKFDEVLKPTDITIEYSDEYEICDDDDDGYDPEDYEADKYDDWKERWLVEE